MKTFMASILLILSTAISAQPLIMTNTPISEFSNWVSIETGRSISFADSEASETQVNINVPDIDKVDPWVVFEATLTGAGLYLTEVEGVYIVSSRPSRKTPDPEEVEPFHYPIETYSFEVYPVNLSDIHQAMSSLLQIWHAEEVTSVGRSLPAFTAHKSDQQSSILVSVPPKLKRDASTFIHTLNKPPRQILVEAIIFETTNLDFQAIGFDVRQINTSGLSFDFGLATGPLAVIGKGGGISYSKDGDIKSVLRALDTSDKTTILSTPELRVMDKASGRVQVGQEIPFITSTNTSENGTITNTVVRQTVGLNFTVQPVIQSDNSIRIKFSTSVGSLTGDSTAADVITTNRSVNTVVTARNGELIYLGGLITDELKNSVVSVPGLSDLPIIGGLFASDEVKQNRTKLSVFLKTTII